MRAKVVMRYTLLQLPALVLFAVILGFLYWVFDLPAVLLGTLLAVWIIKDALMFPFVRHAYETVDESPGSYMLGAQGVVVQDLDPRGYVRARGEMWQAEVAAEDAPLKIDSKVRVRAVKGMLLLVEPLEGGDDEAGTH